MNTIPPKSPSPSVPPRHLVRILLAVVCVSLVSGPLAFGQIITTNIFSTNATYVSVYEPTSNFGTDTVMQASLNNREAMVQWNLTSIPAGVTITSAKITLTGGSFLNSGGTANLLMNQTTSSWSEDTVTWNTKPTFSSSLGSAPSIDGPATNYVYSSPALLSLVQGWFDGSISNYGVYLRNDNSGVIGLNSDDFSNPAALQPLLEVTYVPEPSTAALLLVGAAAVLYRWRRKQVAGLSLPELIAQRASTVSGYPLTPPYHERI